MKFLIEAHHPAHIHFWKFPIKKLIKSGHRVLMIGRDRDVMKHLLSVYDWIPHEIPKQSTGSNRFPLKEMTIRQTAMANAILQFQPDIVASLMGSYATCSKLFGVKNVIFTDSEFQHFNHAVSHPFADILYTPICYWKSLGRKQVKYRGIHELSFTKASDIVPVEEVLEDPYIVIRLSSWNTMHDIGASGVGNSINDFINWASKRFRILISAEESSLADELKKYQMQVPPEDYHRLLAGASLVLTEGASTASEAACLGVPVVYANSTGSRGYLDMLESDYGLVHVSENSSDAIRRAKTLLKSVNEKSVAAFQNSAHRLHADYPGVDDKIVELIEAAAKSVVH